MRLHLHRWTRHHEHSSFVICLLIFHLLNPPSPLSPPPLHPLPDRFILTRLRISFDSTTTFNFLFHLIRVHMITGTHLHRSRDTFYKDKLIRPSRIDKPPCLTSPHLGPLSDLLKFTRNNILESVAKIASFVSATITNTRTRTSINHQPSTAIATYLCQARFSLARIYSRHMHIVSTLV